MVLAVVMISLSHQSLFASAFQPPVTRTPTQQRSSGSGSSSNSLLQYRRTSATAIDDAIMDQPILMQLANGNLAVTEGTIVSSSASSFLQMMAAQHKDLSAMDEYLEYVDKRYARMHPPSPPVASPVVATTTHMLSTTTATTTTTTTANNEQAPLKALGLSRLASAQLRHRLLRKQQHDQRTNKPTTLIGRYVSRFLRPFKYLCGAILIVSAFIRSNGYYTEAGDG